MLTAATSLLHWQVLCFVGPVVVVAAYMRISQYRTRRIMAARAEENLRTRVHIALTDPATATTPPWRGSRRSLVVTSPAGVRWTSRATPTCCWRWRTHDPPPPRPRPPPPRPHSRPRRPPDSDWGPPMNLFHFAIPRNATKASRSKALQHIADTFGIVGKVRHVRSEARFHLYVIEHEAAA